MDFFMPMQPLNLDPITLRGADVTLRPICQNDAEALALAAAESSEHYAYTQVPQGIDEARTYIAQALATANRYPFAILWKNRIVGSTSFMDIQQWHWPENCAMQRTDQPDVVEIGSTWLAASAQRTRCNTEAKFLLLQYAFEVWQVHRVSLRTDERNARSRAAIERLGAMFEGIRRADKPATDCTVRHSAFYSIVQSEWPAVKKRLLEKLGR
jgi:RimJ/RimL family protein N-acetyltransferase